MGIVGKEGGAAEVELEGTGFACDVQNQVTSRYQNEMRQTHLDGFIESFGNVVQIPFQGVDLSNGADSRPCHLCDLRCIERLTRHSLPSQA